MKEDKIKKSAKNALKDTAKELYCDAVKPIAQNIGGIGATLVGFFNQVVLYPLKKLNIIYEQKCIAFLEKMKKKYSNIPLSHQTEPDLNIVGPAMEACKYSIMNDELAELFANLIVSDLDSTTKESCSPAFASIIRQLTASEARLFKKIFLVDSKKSGIAIFTAICEKDDKNRINFIKPQYFVDYTVLGYNNIDGVSRDILGLQRLGLIDITFAEFYPNIVYKRIIQLEEYQKLNEGVQKNHGSDYKIQPFSLGLLRVNELGYDFAKVCIREDL